MFQALMSHVTNMWQQPAVSGQCSTGNQELDKPWRAVSWTESEKQSLLEALYNFQTGNPKVNNLRILLHGPVGSGKSSFFNSVNSTILGRITSRSLADSISGKSFTLMCKSFKIKKGTTGSYFPFMFTDIRGMEEEGEKGVHPKDLSNILQGRIKDGYKLNPETPIPSTDPKYNESPSLDQKIHCLLAVLPAAQISLINKDIMKQMRKLREKARDLGIPQIIIMTKVDEVCPLVKEDIEKVYTSKKIKEKIEECSNTLGVPVNCIFPVKNYHEEADTNIKVDILILKALQQVVHFANDYVEDQEENE